MHLHDVPLTLTYTNSVFFWGRRYKVQNLVLTVGYVSVKFATKTAADHHAFKAQ